MSKSKGLFKKLCTAGLVTAAVVGGVSMLIVTSAVTSQEVQAASDIEINEKNFPDDNFRYYVSNKIDLNDNGKLSETEIKECKEIESFNHYGVRSLKGIEHFTYLEYLDCANNDIRDIDVRKNINLQYLDCSTNYIDSIDVSNNTKLKTLYVSENRLEKIDIGKNVLLEYFECVRNNLTKLDVSKNVKLKHLGCSENYLKNLDVSNNALLETLACDNNNITKLNISNNKKIKEVFVMENCLTDLDTTANTSKEWIAADSQDRNIIVSNGEIALSSISKSLKAENIEDLKGAELSGGKFINITGDTITYVYKIGWFAFGMNVTLHVNGKSPESIQLSKTNIDINRGKDVRISAIVVPNNAFNRNFKWISSNEDVVSVVGGKITANNKGTAIVTVIASNGAKANCKVEVCVPVSKITLDKTKANLNVGDTMKITETVEPEDASNKKLKWSSSDTTVVTVDETGKIVAKKAGDAIITVETEDGEVVATSTVTVKNKTVKVTGVKLNKTSVNPTVGDTVQLTATVSPSDATNKTVYWSSSNPSVATVDGAGKVTAKGAGTAKITVKTDDGSKTATCTITVKNKTVNVTGVKLNKTSVNATAGDAVQLTATVNPENATNKGVTWSSSNTVVATVDSNGKVVAKKAGTAKITVKTKDGEKTSACTVTVEAKKVAKKNGWYNEGGFRYYKDGVAYKGWHKMGKAEGERTEHWSYFGKDGKIYTGWKKMGKAEGEKTEHWSYFGDNGWLRTGWQKMATKANPDGKNAQHWSYFGNNGWLRTGWQKMATSSNPDGKNAQHWSYFGANGWLRIGMQNMATSYNPDGNNKQHRSYFGGNGWLVVNKKFSLSGKNYSADGKGWVTEVKKTSTGNAGTTKAAATSGTYILNLNSKVFHKSNCGSVTRMSASNKKSFNGTRAQAIAQGYTPCHNCNP